jgi:two-component system CheB/CheR fusion protein
LGHFPPATAVAAVPLRAARTAGPSKPSPRELTEQALLRQLAPAAVLVDGHGDILYIHGRTGLYLEPSPGEAGVNNILKMARDGLRRDLTTALHQAVTGTDVVRRPNLHVKTNGDVTAADLTIRPVATGANDPSQPPLYLVILEPIQPAGSTPEQPAAGSEAEAEAEAASERGANWDAEARIAALQQELQAKEEYLQTAVEELETSNEELKSSNEELKSSNEEMQSVNEEMQSVNEELETSKEELQSVNEELATVNAELQTKVADLLRANNDMNNLLAGTGVGTLFVDLQLCIVRFTPAATQVINLIPTDIGRPLDHIVSNLVDYPTLVADIRTVLDTLIPKEAEVRTQAGTWHLMSIWPYRTLDNAIEGAVLTFVDITERKRLEAALREATLREAQTRLAEAMVATVREPLLILDADMRVVSANRAFYRTFQVAGEAVQGQCLYDLDHRLWDLPALRKLLEDILPQDTAFDDFVVTQDFPRIGNRTLRLNARSLLNEAGQPELILLAIEDATGRTPPNPTEP